MKLPVLLIILLSKPIGSLVNASNDLTVVMIAIVLVRLWAVIVIKLKMEG